MSLVELLRVKSWTWLIFWSLVITNIFLFYRSTYKHPVLYVNHSSENRDSIMQRIMMEIWLKLELQIWSTWPRLPPLFIHPATQNMFGELTSVQRCYLLVLVGWLKVWTIFGVWTMLHENLGTLATAHRNRNIPGSPVLHDSHRFSRISNWRMGSPHSISNVKAMVKPVWPMLVCYGAIGLIVLLALLLLFAPTLGTRDRVPNHTILWSWKAI